MCARLMQLRPSAASVAARQRLLRFIEQRLLSAEYLALLRDASGCGTASIVRVVAAGSAARGTSLAGRSDLDVRIVVRHPCDDSSVRAFWERGVLRALHAVRVESLALSRRPTPTTHTPGTSQQSQRGPITRRCSARAFSS